MHRSKLNLAKFLAPSHDSGRKTQLSSSVVFTLTIESDLVRGWLTLPCTTMIWQGCSLSYMNHFDPCKGIEADWKKSLLHQYSFLFAVSCFAYPDWTVFENGSKWRINLKMTSGILFFFSFGFINLNYFLKTNPLPSPKEEQESNFLKLLLYLAAHNITNMHISVI